MICLGSPEILEGILQYPIVETILSTLSPSLPLPMLAPSLRALVTIIQIRPRPNILSSYPHITPTLCHLIGTPSTTPSIVDLCCKLIPLLVLDNTNDVQAVVEPLIQHISGLMRQLSLTQPRLRRPNYGVPLGSALFSLAHVMQNPQSIQILKAKAAAEGKECVLGFIESLIHLTKHPDNKVRVAAASVLVKMQPFTSDPQQPRRVAMLLLSTLIPLLGCEEKYPQMYRTLAIVCTDDPEAVKMACEAGLIVKVSEVIQTADKVNWSNSELISSCLLVYVALCMQGEEYRLAVMDTRVMKEVAIYMTSHTEKQMRAEGLGLRKVKVAACHLLRAFAHSASLLRNGLVTPEIAEGIHSLLAADPEEVVTAYDGVYGTGSLSPKDRQYLVEQELDVKSAVMAAVCNIIPEFTSFQDLIIMQGFMALILEGTKSQYAPLRLNSVWALKHAIYELESGARTKLLAELSPAYLLQLCNDNEPQIQEQALGILRNIACSGDLVAIVTVLETIGVETFMNMLSAKLGEAAVAGVAVAESSSSRKKKGKDPISEEVSTEQQAEAQAQLQPHYDNVILQIVYIISNMIMHASVLRDIFLQREELLKQLLPLFNHGLDDVRSGCAWIVINFTWHEGAQDYDTLNSTTKDQPAWPEASSSFGYPGSSSSSSSGLASSGFGARPNSAALDESLEKAAVKLASLGFKQKLLENRYDLCFDVRERTKVALAKLNQLLERAKQQPLS